MEEPLQSDDQRRAFRGRRLRFSVITSLFSKAATLAINFLALPLLFRCLGARDFALYSTLNAAAAWLAYANLGIGPTLITATASAFCLSDKRKIQELVSSATYPIFTFSTLLACCLITYLFFGHVENVLGPDFADQRNLVLTTGLVLIAATWIKVISSVHESVQTGYHEQGTQNIFLGIGNAVSLLALISLILKRPSITGAICCLTVPIALSRIVNIIVLGRKYHELRPKLARLNWSLSRHLFQSGIGYSMTSVGSFLNHQLPILLVNHILSPVLTSTSATLLNIIALSTGLVTMITIPMCASVADSLVNRDLYWVRKLLAKLIVGTLFYTVVVGAFLCTAGSKLLALAFGRQLLVDTTTLALVSGYLIAVLLEHVLLMTLIALGKVWNTAGLYLLRGVIAVGCVPAMTRTTGVDGVFIVLIALTALITIPCYFILLNSAFKDLQRITESAQSLQCEDTVPACL